MSDTNIVGEKIEKMSSFKEVTWNIDKRFLITCEVGFKIRSSPFYFAGVNCNLSVCPNGTKTIPRDVIIHLFLRMVEWNHESPRVIAEIGLRSSPGTFFKSIITEKNLVNGSFMTCQFSKSEIMKNLDQLNPEENLTIFCKLTIGENCSMEKDTQTERQIRSTDGQWVFPETDDSGKIAYFKEVYAQTEHRCTGVEKVLHDFKNLLNSEDDTDVIVKVKGKEFKLHRGILGTRTPVFAAMFKHDMSEKNKGLVELDDCEPDVFHDFLYYVYTGSVVCLSAENVFGLYKLSDKYQVDDLKEECLDCLKDVLSVDTFCDVITLALKYEEQELLKLAADFFCEKMKDIIVTIKWQTFMCENPTCVNELLIKRTQYEMK